MYAIFRAAGFQYRAEPGELLRLPSLEAEPGQKVEFDEVLLGATDDDVVVGRPLLNGAKVVAEVVGHGRGDKIIVWKFRRRKGYRRKQGHRQDFTQVRVEAVDLGDGRRVESPSAKAATKPARKRAARKTARKTAKKKTTRAKAAKSKGGSKAKKSTSKKKTKE